MSSPARFFGLDIHKYFMVAIAVDAEKNRLYGPRRVEWLDFERWIEQTLTPQGAVVIEMTTNTREVYDLLLPHVANVLVVHPQHVKAIVDAKVKTDQKAAQTLAELLAAGLLHGIWIPNEATRDLRILTSQRRKMGRLGANVHASGERYTTGGITKCGRRDLRSAMVEAANAAIHHHPFWKKEFTRLEFRLGRSRAVVAIARKLLITVWHVLMLEVADKHHDPRDVACSLFKLAYAVKVQNLPDNLSAKEFTRKQLDRLGIGVDLQSIPWGSKVIKLPPSQLKKWAVP